MKIAILMPYLNSSSTVLETLESIKAQTYKDYCLIAVKSVANQDNSFELVDRFCLENSIEVVHLTSKHGRLTSSLNSGLFYILNQDFDFIARIDSDDLWYSEKLERQVSFFQNNEDIHVLGTQIETFSEDSNVDCPLVSYPTEHDEIVRVLFNERNSLAHPSVMFRPEVFYRCGVYDEIYDMCEDYQLWMKISKYFKLANLPDVLVKYRSRISPNYNPFTPVLCKNLYGKAVSLS